MHCQSVATNWNSHSTDDLRPRTHVFTAAIRRDLGAVSPFIRPVRA
jgi:hypothetical protein